MQRQNSIVFYQRRQTTTPGPAEASTFGKLTFTISPAVIVSVLHSSAVDGSMPAPDSSVVPKLIMRGCAQSPDVAAAHLILKNQLLLIVMLTSGFDLAPLTDTSICCCPRLWDTQWLNTARVSKRSLLLNL